MCNFHVSDTIKQMTVIRTVSDGKWDLARRGKFGTPVGMPLWCGWSILGDTNFMAGYYQMRKRKGGAILSLARHYWAEYTPTARQVIIRQVFREGVLAWHALTLLEKKRYNNMKYPPYMQGFGRFMRKYLKENIPSVG